MTQFIRPKILVLEGLYADTAEIIDDIGGIGVEASPWDFEKVSRELKSGLYDGLLLTGGTDVNPTRYGQKPCPVTQTPDYIRDLVELAALKYARDHRMAVLGICRGSQIMCVSQGGTLTQDLELYREPWFAHTSTQHDVEATPEAKTFPRACGGTDMHVVSLHHQCVDYPGRGMRIAARAYDHTPEAIESKDGLMLGVQFHPEMQAYRDKQSLAIFRWLVETAARRAGGKAHPAGNFRDIAEAYTDRLACAWNQYNTDSTGSLEGTFYPDFDYEAETTRTSSTSASSPGGPRISTRKHLPRKAGEASIPSMREGAPTASEMVKLIESSTGHQVTLLDKDGQIVDSTCEEEAWSCDIALGEARERAITVRTETPRSDFLLEESLHVCGRCHIRFDCIEDCDDHKKFVHPQRPVVVDSIEARFAERYPELQEPPAGDPAWEDIDAKVMEIVRECGYEPRDWDDN